MKGYKLFQGYLWHPQAEPLELADWLPEVLDTPRGMEGPVHLLWGAIRPPFSFFDNGMPTATQTFYQLTLLVRTSLKPEMLKPLTTWLDTELSPSLEALPKGVGWLLLEDLREA